MGRLRNFVKPLIPSPIRNWARSIQERKQQQQYAAKPIDHVFTDIFANKRWGADESLSGTGSTLDVTEHVRKMLPDLVRKHDVHTFLDLPCGDFNWMRHVDLGDCLYIGGEIVPDLVAQNQSRYGDAKHRFVQADLTAGPIPRADMLLCRDCFIHLSFAHIKAAVSTIRQSGTTWLLTTTYPELAGNTDIITGMHRQVNMCAPPFNFPPPELLFLERPDASKDEWDRTKCLGLWRVPQLPEIQLGT